MFWRISVIWGICLSAAAETIAGGGDFLRNYSVKDGLRIEQSAWGYVLSPQRLPGGGPRYVMTPFDGGSRRVGVFTFRFQRRIYPVDPRTDGLDPAARYAGNQLNFILSSHRPGKAPPGTGRLCMMGDRVRVTVSERGVRRTEPGTVYFSNLVNCTNLFRISEEKIVVYPRDDVIVFERGGRKEIRSLEGASDYSYYGFSEQEGDGEFIVNEFTDIVLWNRLDPAPARLDNNYFRHVYGGYRADGRYSAPEIAYWRGRCLYDGGYGVERNFPDAVVQFQKAAADRHVFGVYYLALCHYFGVGTPRSEETAASLLKEAAARQYDAAMTLCGILTGDREMLEKAAAQGNAEALYRTGELEKAAARGHAKALYRLGMLALEEKNVAAARDIFAKTLELRFAPGIVKLAELTAAPRRAYELYARAAGLGDPDAMFNAAWLLYGRSEGNRKEILNKAREYVSAGIALDHPLCKVALALFDKTSEEGARRFFSGDREGALKWWESHPSPYGSYAAGICYLNGFGVEENRQTGLALMESALRGGAGEAGLELGRLLEALGREGAAADAYGKSGLPQARLALAGLLRKQRATPERVAEFLASAARDGNLEAMRLYGEYLAAAVPRRLTEASKWWSQYLDARIERDNNSADGPYWRELPCCLPAETRDGVPLEYSSDLDDPARVREFYQRYGH